MNKSIIVGILSLSLILLIDCSCSNKKNTKDQEAVVKYSELNSLYHKPLIEWNKDVVAFERDLILKYAERRNWKLIETNTGLYYDIYIHGNGEEAHVGQNAEFSFIVSKLDGTNLYYSDSTGNREILLGHTNEESGLDEAFQLMRIGDKAHLILPPHLAFGVPGDGYLIPPRTILIYDVELVDLKY